VLIDMKTPGVETRPIKLISGESPFCETFFTDVKIPKDNLVGKAERRLGDRQAAAAIRAPEHLRRLRRRRRGRAARRRPGEIAKRYVGLDERRAGRRRPARPHHPNKMDFQAFS
jgi:hypothetical protein